MENGYKYVNYRPETTWDKVNPYPVEIRDGNARRCVSEKEFSDMYEEYLEQKHAYEVSTGKVTSKDAARMDARVIAMANIRTAANYLWNGWFEANIFQEHLLDEILLWANALNELRVTFGETRHFPSKVTIQRIINARAKMQKLLQDEFDHWATKEE